MTERGIRVSRTLTTDITNDISCQSIGASYTHIENLTSAICEDTSRIVIYHAKLTSLAGLEKALHIKHAFLGFNRIAAFRPEDTAICVDVLDLAGNPIKSLANAPRCKELIVSATLIEDLTGSPEGIEIIRCGHSTHLRSLRGCPSSVILIECSCAPNLTISPEDLPPGLIELIY